MSIKLSTNIAVAAFLLNKRGEVLLGKRCCGQGIGTWALPGGKLEYGEVPLVAIKREIKEETGITLLDLDISKNPYGTTIFKQPKDHWLTLYFTAQIDQQPIVMEPDKMNPWRWFNKNRLPTNLFKPLLWYKLQQDSK